jgi:predicted DNA-binding protein
MSLPLVDLRGKITHETDAVLDAMSKASGRDRSEIVREVLADWAAQKIHEASLLDMALRREGLRGITGGAAGSPRDSQGFAGNGGDSQGSRSRAA